MLYYIRYAFYQINQTKKVFGDTCPIHIIIQENNNKYFNFLKWYVMSYYLE